MLNPPKLNNSILEKLFERDIISDNEIKEILAFDKTLLIDDCLGLINFSSAYYENMEHDFDDDDDISYNLLIYALFLLKEIDAKNQLNLIIELLHWSEAKLDYWFGDVFTEYFWILVYHFGLTQIEILVDFLKQENLEPFCKDQVALALNQIYNHNPYSAKIISDYWTELLEFYNNLPEDSELIDEVYFSFFVGYIVQPNDYQMQLIENLYKKNQIDFSINGRFNEYADIGQTEKKILSIFDVNKDLISFQNDPPEDFMPSFMQELKRMASQFNIVDKKINRNDPCPCGSGQKYKKCCLN